MDAEERDLALFAALSLLCAGVAWTVDHVIFSAVIVFFGVAALIGVTESHWR